jgi:hypothetical protein
MKIREYLNESNGMRNWRVDIQLNTNEPDKKTAMRKVNKWVADAKRIVKSVASDVKVKPLKDAMWMMANKMVDGDIHKTWDVSLNLWASVPEKKAKKYRSIEDKLDKIKMGSIKVSRSAVIADITKDSGDEFDDWVDPTDMEKTWQA